MSPDLSTLSATHLALLGSAVTLFSTSLGALPTL